MNLHQFIPIGKLAKPHGVRGVLKFIADYTFLDTFLQTKALFIEDGNSKLPFIVIKIEYTVGNQYLVTLEDINSKEAAEKIKNRDVFLPKDIAESLIKEDEWEETFAYLEGYELQNENKEKVGIIEEVITMPQHELAKLIIDNREVLIPLEEELIIDINEKKQIITIMIPDGLLDIYLQG